MRVVCDYIMLALVFVSSLANKKYRLAILTLVVLMFLEIAVSGGIAEDNNFFLSAGIICTTVLIVKDSIENNDKSCFNTYNPYSTKSNMPSWLRTTFLALFCFTFIIRVIVAMLGKP